MPAGSIGLSVWIGGWTGNLQITIGGDTLTRTPAGVTSPARVLDDLVTYARAAWPAVTWSWSVAAGVITIAASTAFTLNGSGNAPTRLGFTVPSASATSHTAGAAMAGLWPEAMVHADDLRQAADGGALTYGAASWADTPATAPRRPQIAATATAAQVVAWTEALESIVYPGKVDVVGSGEALTTYRLKQSRSRPLGHAGHHEVTVEALR